MITGSNGAGKSTFLDALSYGLFKKPFRNINIPALVNTINQKDCLVEIEFSVNNRSYLIRRGIKPVIFEIYSNGELIPQPANVYDYQDNLEKVILKINHKTFCQIVVLGSANFIPFMLLTPQNRREIIENLLDIGVFSKMNVILKQDQKKNEEFIASITSKEKLVQSKINLMEKHIKEIQTNNADLLSDLQKRIDSTEVNITSFKAKKAELDIELEELKKESTQASATLMISISKGKDAILQLQNRSKKLKKYSDDFSELEKCSACNQTITEEAKVNLKENYDQRIENIETNQETLQKKIDKLESDLELSLEIEQKIKDKKKEIDKLTSEVSAESRLKKSLLSQLGSLQAAKQEIDTTDLEKHQKALSKLLSRRNEAFEERELLSNAGMLLKDDGIKSMIISQYIPVINSLINKYLQQMDFYCLFEIDETFKETMKAIYKDEMGYTSLSQGERMRVDIALLFTWREISRMRNAAYTNILILDEIMDSSLDAAGTEEFLKIIQKIAQSGNIFVISHKSDQIAEKFESNIMFKKVSNFSEMVKE